MASSEQVNSGQNAPEKKSWRDAVAVYGRPYVIRMLFLGFSSGLPFLLVFGTLSFWMREAGVNLTTIGLMSGVGLAYAFKWLWSPLVDKMPLPLLTRLVGRRKSWLLLGQILIVIGLLLAATSDPGVHLERMVWAAVLTAFGSATQDISLDAFRIESAKSEDQAAMAATYMAGYRIAMLWAGAGALWLTAIFDGLANGNVYHLDSWHKTYFVMAICMLVGVIATLFSPEPSHGDKKEKTKNFVQWVEIAFVEPFVDFVVRYRSRVVILLLLVSTYRICDIVLSIMTSPFYVDMGFSKAEVASVVKVFGVVMVLLGTFVGGSICNRWGVMRTLVIGGAINAVSILMYAWLATQGHSMTALTITISVENFTSGLATAAFIAFLSSLTNVKFCATQYALLSSLMALLPKLVGMASGDFVTHFGYVHFFVATACLGVPVFLLSLWVWWAENRASSRDAASSA